VSAREPEKGPKKPPHQWVYDGKGGGHRGEFDFTCTVCGETDWLSGASQRAGEKPDPGECSGKAAK